MCGKCGLGSFREGKIPTNRAPAAFKLEPSSEHVVQSGAESWAVAFSPDGAYFAWSRGHRTVTVVPWDNHNKTIVTNEDNDNKDGVRQLSINCGELVHSLAFGSATPDGAVRPGSGQRYRFKHVNNLLLATGLANGRIRVWDVQCESMVFELLDHTQLVRDLKFAPNGELQLLSASRDGTIKFWDLTDDGNMYCTLRHPRRGSWVYSVAWSPDCSMVASVGNERQAILWNVARREKLTSLVGHHHDVVSVDFSPDSALVVTASWDTRVLVFDTHTYHVLRELCHLYPSPSPLFASGTTGHWVRSVQVSHHGGTVATTADDGYVRLWSIDSDEMPQSVGEVTDGLCSAFCPDDTMLAVGSRSGSVTFLCHHSQHSLPTLQHLCRVVVRKTTANVDPLYLPNKLKNYLKYKIGWPGAN